MNTKQIEVLLVEDDPGDIDLMVEGLQGSKVLVNLGIVGDGEEAMLYLRKVGKYAKNPTPDLILLDLNLPKKTAETSSEKSKLTIILNIYLS